MSDHLAQMTEEDIRHLRDNLLYDLDLVASFLLPDETLYPFPDLYKYWWAEHLEMLFDKTNRIPYRFALGLPRGFVKTTVLKLLCVIAVLYNLRQFIVISCQREDRSVDFLTDVENMLLSQNVTAVFGDYAARMNASGQNMRNTKATKQFYQPGNKKLTILMAIGAGTAIRGVNLDMQRPDWLILDDVQSRDSAFSALENATLTAWVTLTLLKAGARVGLAVSFIGNLYNDQCLLYKFMHSTEWRTIVTGAILADGSALWPSFKGIPELAAEFRHDVSMGLAAGFFAEVQNDIRPAMSRLLDTSRIELTEPAPTEAYTGFYVTIDPAGNTRVSDNSSIIAHGLIDHQIHHMEGYSQRLNPEDTIKLALHLALKWSCSAIFIESAQYQASLAFWMERIMTEYGLDGQIEVIPFPNVKGAKLQRILNWASGAEAKTFIFASPDLLALAIWEAHSYDTRNQKNKDDTLDNLSMGVTVAAKYPDNIYVRDHTYSQKHRTAVTQFMSTFSTVPIHATQSYGY